jgi:hypothetical protein
MMYVLVLAAALAAEVEGEASTPASPVFRLSVGGQVGFPHLVGVTAIGGFLNQGKRRFDLDVLYEPSLMLQSYSVGAGYHVLDTPFFVGGRLRLLQFSPAWARGGGDAWLGMGLELGGRFQVFNDKGLVHVALFATWVPAQATNLKVLVGLSVGFSWEVWTLVR